MILRFSTPNSISFYTPFNCTFDCSTRSNVPKKTLMPNKVTSVSCNHIASWSCNVIPVSTHVNKTIAIHETVVSYIQSFLALDVEGFQVVFVLRSPAVEHHVGLGDEHIRRRQPQFPQACRGSHGIPLEPVDEGYQHISHGTCKSHTLQIRKIREWSKYVVANIANLVARFSNHLAKHVECFRWIAMRMARRQRTLAKNAEQVLESHDEV